MKEKETLHPFSSMISKTLQSPTRRKKTQINYLNNIKVNSNPLLHPPPFPTLNPTTLAENDGLNIPLRFPALPLRLEVVPQRLTQSIFPSIHRLAMMSRQTILCALLVRKVGFLD